MMVIARSFRSYVVPFLFLALILIGWDLSKPRYPGSHFTHPIDNIAAPAPPNNPNEAIFKETRKHARTSVLTMRRLVTIESTSTVMMWSLNEIEQRQHNWIGVLVFEGSEQLRASNPAAGWCNVTALLNEPGED